MRRGFRALASVIAVTVVGIGLSYLTEHAFLKRAYEDLAFRIDPTAARAYEYGSAHLDVENDARMYDINRASYFLLRAAAIDPYYPYLNHQLARVAFLKSEFDLALARIDVEIEHHGSEHHNSYYIRGLIEGYSGRYAASIADYETYLRFDPRNWAAMNDLAWVLLKNERYKKSPENYERRTTDFSR